MQGVRPQPRIQLVDALRGYALMGLFLIHMVEYYELYGANPRAEPVNSTMFFLFGGKAYAMFGLLFGVSFYILMEGPGTPGRGFSRTVRLAPDGSAAHGLPAQPGLRR